MDYSIDQLLHMERGQCFTAEQLDRLALTSSLDDSLLSSRDRDLRERFKQHLGDDNCKHNHPASCRGIYEELRIDYLRTGRLLKTA